MKDQLLTTLRKSRDYSLAVAEAMPGNDYTLKPEGAGWNFAQLISHMAYGIGWWKDNFILGTETEWLEPKLNGGKKELIDQLKAAYNSLEGVLESLELNEDKIYGFFATTDHLTHHRAQAVIYLRTRGITPPEYSF